MLQLKEKLSKWNCYCCVTVTKDAKLVQSLLWVQVPHYRHLPGSAVISTSEACHRVLADTKEPLAGTVNRIDILFIASLFVWTL